jgi:uncharacterized protein YggE
MRKHCSFLYLTCLLGLSACAHPHAIVLSPTAPEGVRVYGVGEASAAPDVARTQLGVDVRAATPEQAMADAAQRMAAVTAALKQLGIPDADLRTSQYSLGFELNPPPPQPQPTAAARPAGAGQVQPPAAASPVPSGYYRVVSTLAVTIRDLKLVGRVLQVAAQADANNVAGIRFDLEDDSAIVAQARSKAVADAQHSAHELAKLAGVELGEVVSITESEPQSSYGEGNTYALHSASGGVPFVPVEQGEVTVHYDVQLVFATRHK